MDKTLTDIRDFTTTPLPIPKIFLVVYLLGEETGKPVAAPSRLGRGLVLGGVPVGDDQFVLNFVQKVTKRVRGTINQPHNLLHAHGYFDEAWHVHRLSLARRLDYLMQVVAPGTPGVKEELKHVNAQLRTAEVAALGVDCYHTEEMEKRGALPESAAAVAKRATLKTSDGGLGITCSTSTRRHFSFPFIPLFPFFTTRGPYHYFSFSQDF